MGGGQGTLTGPDFSKGVDISEVPEGGTLLGHANGEAVVLARRGAEVFAVGASCTHYGGPLAEGAVVGDTIRCPWHHACFSLRTGEPLRAPALNPIASYEISRTATRVTVLGKSTAGAKPTPPRSPLSVVIIGAGAAGESAAEALRAAGYTGPVTMLGAEDSVPTDRPNLSKDYLAGNAPEEWIPLRPAEWFAERNIELRIGTRVEALDTAARTVTLAGGEKLTYGALILATGAEPVRLSIPGATQEHVRYLRSLADSRAIIERATKAKRAVVIGASFIGLEAAASLRARGIETHVVGPEERPLERVLGAALGDFVRKLHEEHGVVFHLGQKPASIEADSVTLENGEKIAADLVVVGVGVRPRLELAERAGLSLDRGVSVDEHLRTSAEGVYAAGDIARWPDPHTGERIRVEHWVVAQRQGRCAARNVLGFDERYDAVPFFWSQHYDVPIVYVGHAERFEHADVAGNIEGRDCSVAFRRGGRTLAVASIYRDRENLAAEVALEHDDEASLGAIVPPTAK